jgi:thiol:disulfide interchange protein
MRIALLLIVFVAGCASLQEGKWTKDGSTPQDFEVIDAQCQVSALAASNEINTMHTMINYTGCMKAAGWAPPVIAKEEEHEAPKHAAAKHDTAKHDMAQHEAPKDAAPKDESPPGDTPKH